MIAIHFIVKGVGDIKITVSYGQSKDIKPLNNQNKVRFRQHGMYHHFPQASSSSGCSAWEL